RAFLASMKEKFLEKLKRFPKLADRKAMLRSMTLRQFDDVVTAPLHGYKNTDDYWTRASSKPGLINIRVPTLLINAKNDPFLPASFLPSPAEVSSAVTLDFPDTGGHAGFVSGAFPGRLDWLPQRILDFFQDEQENQVHLYHGEYGENLT
ncbi:MAG: YheT family hydrolase, partial [Burkholderiales bacterium]